MSEQKRGQLSERIKIKSKELLNYEIDVKELRFMAYIQYILCNEQEYKISKIDNEEIIILKKWIDKKYITDNHCKLKITKKFWDIICEILFLGYVDLGETK